nr:LuxR C-terminal-related transcriptional regulator [Actinomycetota bacterium]
LVGTDHAAAGGALARSWGLHERLARLVESHHATDPGDGAARVVRLADMLAHYERQAPVDIDCMLDVAERAGLTRDALGALLYDVAFPLPPAARETAPCPLSARELDVIRRLGEGMLYKQIAAAEGLSPSTVRNHLHRAYGKLQVADRAQAVLVASRCGWI